MSNPYPTYPAYPGGAQYTPPPVPPASADPIISRLRPRDVVGVLDQSFRLYRRYFLTFIAITAVVFVPVQVLTQGLTLFLQGDPNSLIDSETGTFSGSAANSYFTGIMVLVGVVGILSVVGAVLQYISQGALTAAVADSHLDRPVSFGSAYRRVSKHIGPLLGVMGLQLLITLAAFLPIILILVFALAALIGSTAGAIGGSDSGAFAGGAFGLICGAYCLFLVALIALLYVYVRLLVMVPAVVVENLGPVQAWRRSWKLVEGQWWRTFGMLLLLGLLGLVISLGPAFMLGGIAGYMSNSINSTAVSVVTALVTIVVTLIYTPLELTARTLYYFDLRVRKEGFDIEQAMAQAYNPYWQGGAQGYAYGGYAGQPGSGQGQYAGYAQQATPQVAPPVLGSEQQGGGYSAGQGYSTGTPTQQIAGGGYGTMPYQQTGAVETPPASQQTVNLGAGPSASSEETPAYPPPQDTYPTPGWLERPITQSPEAPEETTGGGSASDADAGMTSDGDPPGGATRGENEG